MGAPIWAMWTVILLLAGVVGAAWLLCRWGVVSGHTSARVGPRTHALPTADCQRDSDTEIDDGDEGDEEPRWLPESAFDKASAPLPHAESLITIAAFDQPYEAHLARLRLEQNQIPAVITDENIVGMDWLYANAVGGVKVQVPQSACESALRVLKRPRQRMMGQPDWPDQPPPEPIGVRPTISDGADPAPTCPRCGSTEVYRVPAMRRSIFTGILLLGFPLPIWARRYECDTCSHRFKG